MAVEVTGADFDTLGTKIDGLELTAAESAILEAVLARAAEANDEVSGFVLGECIVNRQLPSGNKILIDFTGAGRDQLDWGDRMKIVIIGDTAG